MACFYTGLKLPFMFMSPPRVGIDLPKIGIASFISFLKASKT
jgi:hypothetical protein